jgi:hypothetical protein
MDILLTGEDDLDFETTPNQLTLISGREAVRQHWLIRMRHFRGEWFLDRRTGMPFYEQIFTKKVTEETVSYLFRKCATTTPGIATVESLFFTIGADRKLSLEIEGKLEPWVDDESQAYRFVFEELIMPQRAAAEQE